MSSMTRSKTQVLRGYLPDQCFQHENGVIAKVARLEASVAPVNEDLLLENLADRLNRWTVSDGQAVRNRAPGFVDPLRFRNQYVALEPDGQVVYYIWPLVLRCRRFGCAKVQTFANRDAWSAATNPAVCDLCGTRREQFPYVMVHPCGRDAELAVPQCPEHQSRHVYLEDTGSFETSQWRCRAPGCNGATIGSGAMRFRACSCGEPGGFVSMTVRQSSRYIPQTFSFVSFDRAPLARLREEPGAEKVIVGSFLGFFQDFNQALEDARKARTGNPATWEIILQALRNANAPDAIIAEARRNHFGEAGDAFREIDNLVPGEVVSEIGQSQGARERTLVFGGAGNLRTHRLTDFRQAAISAGRQGAVARLNAAKQGLLTAGFSDLLVVENFPVALVAYGYTRLGSQPRNVRLRAFPQPRQSNLRDKTPLYVSKSQTEAVFLELDARRVLGWLVANQVLAPPELPADVDAEVAAKAALLTAQARDVEVARHIHLLQHTLAHALIRNLGERAGFGEGTMAEYLIPSLLTIGLYADVHQEFTLGALVSLAEHRLVEWLVATEDGARRCPWDPQCAHDDGACAQCLHLAFGCQDFNNLLDRAVLFGSPAGHTPMILRGFWT
jgi:hypothetical protein